MTTSGHRRHLHGTRTGAGRAQRPCDVGPLSGAARDSDPGGMEQNRRALRFVIVPKVDHPWFREVHRGALTEAGLLQDRVGGSISVEYRAPASPRVEEQNAVLQRLAAERPSGIAVDPVDTPAHLSGMVAARESGVPVVVFDSPSPDPAFPSVGNDFREQGSVAAERLVALIGRTGEVAVMRGVPTAPNHLQRYEAQIDVLQRYPAITVVDGGADYDDISRAEREAAAVLTAHPQLNGYLCCDASGPIGIAAALRSAGRVGRVRVVGMDGIEPILREIRDGVLESSVATIPSMQGAMAVLMLWQAANGIRIPRQIDTGIDVITRDNVDRFLPTSSV